MNVKSQFRLGYFMRLVADRFRIDIHLSSLDIISTSIVCLKQHNSFVKLCLELSHNYKLIGS